MEEIQSTQNPLSYTLIEKKFILEKGSRMTDFRTEVRKFNTEEAAVIEMKAMIASGDPSMGDTYRIIPQYEIVGSGMKPKTT